MTGIATLPATVPTVPANGIMPGMMTVKTHKEPTKCLVVSDIHRGAPYSDAATADVLLEKELREENGITHCVLLGDIYENINLFIKHLPEDDQKTALELRITEHMDHLRRLVKNHPWCKFHFLPGNHEWLPEFDKALDALQKELGDDRLEINRHHIRIGDGLFVHGDLSRNPRKYHFHTYDGDPDPYDNLDGRYDEGRRELHQNRWRQKIEDMGAVWLPWPVAKMFHSALNCSKKILKWAHDYDHRDSFTARSMGTLSITPPKDGQSILDGVHHIFSGHTHDPYTGFDFKDPATGRDYCFHNTGASVFRIAHINRHCFNALHVTLDSPDLEHATITDVSSVKWPQHHWRAPYQPGIAIR